MRLHALASTLALLAASHAAWAAPPAATQEPPACIDVEVNGERVPSYECMSARLAPTADRTVPPAAQLASERTATRPSNEIGLFNQAATHQRMGNTFGSSVHPQRPPTPPPVSPVVRP